MTDEEIESRFTKLEERYTVLKDEIVEIKKVQGEMKSKQEDAALDNKDLTKNLALLNQNLEHHMELHSHDDKKKVRAIDVVLGVGMFIIAGSNLWLNFSK